jgi:UrcA family protein
LRPPTAPRASARLNLFQEERVRVQIYTAIAAVMIPFAANAEDGRGIRTTRIVVAYADLDLEEPHDARVMAARLDRAARRACGGSPSFDPHYDIARYWAVRSFDECYNNAIKAALAELRAPLVSQAHANQMQSSSLPPSPSR